MYKIIFKDVQVKMSSSNDEYDTKRRNDKDHRNAR